MDCTAVTDKSTLSTLVRKAQHGDEDALGELVELTQKDLFRFCYYLTGQKHVAEDLCQGTYVKALESIKKLKDPEAFKSWLFQSAKNEYLDFLKSPRSREVPESDNENPLNPPYLNIPASEISIQVKDALQKLPPDQKLILLLVDLEGQSYFDAALVLKISKAAVTTQVFRAREAFKKIFDKS